jgi:hypothetical protein
VNLASGAAAAALLAMVATKAGAQPVTIGELTFDDHLGGLTLHSGSGSGTLDDPFVLMEDITEDGPAIVTIRGLRADFGNRVGTQHSVGFALTKIVRNLTRRNWDSFEVELREVLSRSSSYQDGLSFAQDAKADLLLGSDRFTQAYKTDEPLDSIVYSGATILPGETVTVRMVITDYSPAYEFYLLQRRNAPVAELSAVAAARPSPRRRAGSARRHRRDPRTGHCAAPRRRRRGPTHPGTGRSG